MTRLTTATVRDVIAPDGGVLTTMNATTTTKKRKIRRITAETGRPYGHQPGSDYLDVTVSCAPDGSDAEAMVTWGSAQEQDEEHGREDVSASSLDGLTRAVQDARGSGDDDDDVWGWTEVRTYLATAITRARRAMRD